MSTGQSWEGKRDALVIEIVMEFIVESLDILVRGNDLLQIVVLKSRVNNKPTMDSRPYGGTLSSPAPCRKLDNTPGGVPLIVGMEIFRG